MAIRLLPRSFSAQARPTACSMWLPTGSDGGSTFTVSGGAPPSSVPRRVAINSSAGYPCSHIAAASRYEAVIQSSGPSAAALPT